MRSRPARDDRDQAITPRVEVALIEPARDAGARFAEGSLAAMPRPDAGGRAVRADVVLMIAKRAPPLLLDGAVFDPALAGQTIWRRCDHILLRWNVEPFNDEKPIARAEAARVRERCRTGRDFASHG